MGARAGAMTEIEIDSLQIFDVVPKPLSIVDLMKTVRRALG